MPSISLGPDALVTITANEPPIVNDGASFGPRVVTGTFDVRGAGRWNTFPAYSATLAADLDGQRFQDAFSVRRRAARALVGVARRAALELQRSAGGALFELSHRAEGARGEPVFFWRAAFGWVEIAKGFERRVQARVDERTFEPRRPDFDSRAAAALVRVLQLGADNLHVAIDAPANRAVFGAR